MPTVSSLPSSSKTWACQPGSTSPSTISSAHVLRARRSSLASASVRTTVAVLSVRPGGPSVGPSSIFGTLQALQTGRLPTCRSCTIEHRGARSLRSRPPGRRQPGAAVRIQRPDNAVVAGRLRTITAGSSVRSPGRTSTARSPSAGIAIISDVPHELVIGWRAGFDDRGPTLVTSVRCIIERRSHQQPLAPVGGANGLDHARPENRRVRPQRVGRDRRHRLRGRFEDLTRDIRARLNSLRSVIHQPESSHIKTSSSSPNRL